jgi:hypothetical protein
MTTLESTFPADLRDAILSEVEADAERLARHVINLVHDNLRDYGNRHDYDVESTIESVDWSVKLSDGAVTITVGWTDEQMLRWEFGTSDHTVPGDPVLVFEFDADEYPYLAEMFDNGVAYLPEADVSGLPASRAIRDAMNQLRREAGT